MKHNLVAAAACLCLMMLSIPGLSQKKGPELIDSLEKELPRLKEDTAKVRALQLLSFAWYQVDIRKSFGPGEEGLRLAERLQWKLGLAMMHSNMGLFITDTGNPVLGIKHLKQSYSCYKDLGDQAGMANMLTDIGRTYYMQSDYPSAVGNFFQALPIAEAMKDDDEMAMIYTNLFACYLKENDYKKAVGYAELGLKHARMAGSLRFEEKTMLQIGLGKGYLKDTVAAKIYMDSALVMAERMGSKVEVATALTNRATMESSPRGQIAIMLRAEKALMESNPNSTSMMINNANLGVNYLTLAKENPVGGRDSMLKKSRDYLLRARDMAERRKNPGVVSEILPSLVELEEFQGHYKQALQYNKRAQELSDSTYSQENKNQIASLEAKHTVELKDAELTVSQLKLSDERKTTIGLIAGLVLLAGFGALLYLQSRGRKKANAALEQANRELGAANRSLETANRELEEANQVKARFFGILSHDLRGPVAHLLHFLQVQKKAPHLLAGGQQETQRRQITDSAENLLNTMEEMLLWSKQQMTSFQPNPKNTAVDELFDYLQKFFGEPGAVNLLFQAADDLTVFTDENYLRVIMQNLTSNAIKALKDRPDATIAWNAKKEGNNLVLSIADNGPGIALEHQEILYDESVADNARDGFGLHVVRDLAKAIHCRLDVRSEPGKGTTFSLILPPAA
jgi:signal transduction histidine kinase